MSKAFCTIFIACIFSSIACVSWHDAEKLGSRAESVHSRVAILQPDLNRFKGRGPFSVVEKRGRELPIDFANNLAFDHFYAETPDKIPVVFITHGNYSSRAAHAAQARYLASWGFHVMVTDLPNRNQWLENGRRLKALTELIYRWPSMLGSNADATRMILVGHSFGGSASILAASQGAPVLGLVLLDPAVVHRRVLTDMRSIDFPVVLLGADKTVFTSRGREHFWKHVGGDILEVSVPRATHDDAQGPSMFSRSALGVDPFTSRNRQKTFRSMLAVSVLGLATSGTLDFPRNIFDHHQRQGEIQDLKFRSRLSASTK